MNPVDLLRSISDAYFDGLKSKATTVFGKLGVDFVHGGVNAVIPDLAGYVPVGGVIQSMPPNMSGSTQPQTSAIPDMPDPNSGPHVHFPDFPKP